jgi:signal transduction histidine kinase
MYGVQDFAAIGVWAGEKPMAVICVDHKTSGRPIASEQLEALRLFAGYAGLAIENAKLNNALQNELTQRKKFIEELESKNAELERFTYTVSHDLKSPLVTINGFLGYVEKDARAGDFEKLKSNMHRIHMAVDKMQRLLKDLLELSRIGRLINTPVEISFNEIVKDAVEILQGQLKERNLTVEYQETDLMIKGDHTRLVEVLQNLLENAIKFMGDQPKPHIQIDSQINEQEEIVFSVRDNGIGIEPEYHEKIFGLFNKLDSDSTGTGIGLTLVKRIIEVHGGRIWVESKMGEGTTFYFTLPHA